MRELLTAAVLMLTALLPSLGAAEARAVTDDRVRIRSHLVEVEEELLAADVSHLSPALRAARAANIERLRAYRFAGEFPHNTYTEGLTPVFIDAADRACAVGHLIIESGHADAARAIAARENLARLPDMKSPEVGAWLATSGLTAAEAARIQPEYRGLFCGEECPCEHAGASKPVCGSDGKTYYNACAARACGQFVFNYGCCEAAPKSVAEDEHEGSLCFDLASYCPTNVAAPGPPWDVDPPPGEKEEVGGCSSVPASTPTPWLLLVAGAALRRRRTNTRRRI